MKNSVIASVAFAALAAFVPAQAPDSVHHAAHTVAILHDTMLDPPSFVLDGVYVTKPSKKGNITFCYAFRSHNRMGGYSEGRAFEDGDRDGRFREFSDDDGNGRFPGYDLGWSAPCKEKNIEREITTDVAALAPKFYRKTR